MEKWLEKLLEFVKENKRIPRCFETYNCYEVEDYMPTITTKVGMLNGSSNVIVINEKRIN